MKTTGHSITRLHLLLSLNASSSFSMRLSRLSSNEDFWNLFGEDISPSIIWSWLTPLIRSLHLRQWASLFTQRAWQWLTDKSLNFMAILHAYLEQLVFAWRGSQQYAQRACSINFSLWIVWALPVSKITWQDLSQWIQEHLLSTGIFFKTWKYEDLLKVAISQKIHLKKNIISQGKFF